MDIRERIRSAAAVQNVSIRALSLNAGLSDSALHKYMTGGIQSLTVDTLNKIAIALDLPLQKLMFGEQDGLLPRDPQEDEADLMVLWSAIPAARKAQAKAILKTFVTDWDD